MTDVLNNSGYEYIVSLCKAIGKFTEQEESRNPSIFVYKRSNLRFALERALYFNYANSNYFFDTFTERRVGDRSKKIVVGDETEQKLISLLCAINEADISIREINWIKRLQNMIRYIVRYCIICSGINKIANHIRYSINNLKQRNTHPKILF